MLTAVWVTMINWMLGRKFSLKGHGRAMIFFKLPQVFPNVRGKKSRFPQVGAQPFVRLRKPRIISHLGSVVKLQLCDFCYYQISHIFFIGELCGQWVKTKLHVF